MSTELLAQLNAIILEFRDSSKSDIDQIVDGLIAIAVASGRLQAIACDEIAFVIGKNTRATFSLGNCDRRFRTVLARLFIRCSESYPKSMDGNVYGFESHVILQYGQNESANLLVKTKNTQAFPELLLCVD